MHIISSINVWFDLYIDYRNIFPFIYIFSEIFDLYVFNHRITSTGFSRCVPNDSCFNFTYDYCKKYLFFILERIMYGAVKYVKKGE